MILRSILICFVSTAAWGATKPPSVEDVQASFIYHFPSYIDWPTPEAKSDAKGDAKVDASLAGSNAAVVVANAASASATSSSNDTSHFIIVVVGKTGVTESLKTLAKNRKVVGRDIEISTDSEDLNKKPVQIAVIGRQPGAAAAASLKKVEHSGILTVTTIDGDRDFGAVIRLMQEKDNVRFHIDNELAKSRGFKIGSQLLKLNH